jgi:hypothetical protein
MRIPWRDLKNVELEALRHRQVGKLSSETIFPLRKLSRRCGRDPDAGKCICYHGSLALLYEFDEDWKNAIKHRRVEISLIQRLYETLAKNTPSVRRYATQNYRASDLRQRRKILDQLRQKESTEPSTSPNRRAARQRTIRAQRKGGRR